MSRRSSRSAPKKSASLPPNIRRGLVSLAEGNETIVSGMLSLPQTKPKDTDDIATALAECMSVNRLSAEALLGRFFDKTLLSEYCTVRLGKSGKGNEAILAARIAREWNRPDFELEAPPTSTAATASKKKNDVARVREPGGPRVTKKPRVEAETAAGAASADLPFAVDRASPRVWVTDAPGDRHPFKLCLVSTDGKRFAILNEHDEGGSGRENGGFVLFRQAATSECVEKLPGNKIGEIGGGPLTGPEGRMIYDLTPTLREEIDSILVKEE